ncbi:MAG: hisH [Peptococcaceae bacterium]|jgi:glutamine amidotransferase|nr:hisH [Peptococcaceae bacterium]
MKTAVIDYGLGNLASVAQGLKAAGLEPLITRERHEILEARAVVLPGVGAFPKGMENLKDLGLLPVIAEVVQRGTPFLGICLGMQLLFEEGEEYGKHQGLGFIKGKVVRFPKGLKVPHMGWNTLKIERSHPLLTGVPDNSYVYFVHSYCGAEYNSSHVAATSFYGIEFPAIVCFNNIMGIQFHPEKSSQIGLKILKNFGELVSHVGNPGD